MANKQRGLGRGLDALLGAQTSTSNQQKMLQLTQLVPGKYQPRGAMEESALDELAQSIKVHGIMQPILVRYQAEGLYEIIAGERRFQAAKRAGLVEVPVLVKEVDDQSSAVMALIENIQREDLNPIEEARGMTRLIKEFSLTHEQVAEVLGKSRTAITNTLRLTSLAVSVQEWLIKGAIEMGHARALITLSSAEQVQLAQKIILNKWSVRQAEQQVKTVKLDQENLEASEKSSKSIKPEAVNNNLRQLEEQLSDQLAVQVSLHASKKGLTFAAEFVDQAALEQFINRILR